MCAFLFPKPGSHLEINNRSYLLKICMYV
jgi:hypothetical protein